ncbi:TIR domain-containing protein [Cohnella luojiensis]|uniref:Molecular chaperone Tir n=1 Tax=Cohnella luojiensis TaxID=652876 RepID=A0A4Y8LZJ3_9BACL|nr:TIR domain-containing protein [Cohnella luojiensis]TFE27170.1 molecular chaperone Tir [Cohnella luojiensis]
MPLTEEIHLRYNLYISHSWNHNDAHKDLDSLIKGRNDFDYRTYSLSPHHPVNQIKGERKLYETIKNKMKFCDAVIILCGVYPTYSRWINKELIACKDELNKPLIAVQRFDSSHTSFIVKDRADVIVDWNADNLINAIKRVVAGAK